MSEELLLKMHDIAGLDPIGNWPLALGWWLIIIIAVILLVLIIWFYLKNKKYKTSWLYSIYIRLTALENTIKNNAKKNVINELSECLRQIAVKQYPREACASISGEAWLIWLKEHDPKHFDWLQYGTPLILGPYAPDLQNVSVAELRTLIQAAKKWVKQ